MINQQFCQRIIYNECPDEKKVILGIKVDEDDNFITFETANRILKISKHKIISISETQQLFQSNKEVES